MKLYLDDDSKGRELIAHLCKAGHEVVTPRDAGLSGAADPQHMLYALRSQLTLLTRNYEDFEVLHMVVVESGGHHRGILVIRADNDRTRDMRPAAVVAAIARLDAAKVPIADQYTILNQWR